MNKTEVRFNMNKHQHLATAALVGALVALTAIPASATAPAVTLHLDGTHSVDGDYHQGSFTAPAPLCSSGTWLGNGGGAYAPRADQASREQQIAVANKVYADRGLQPWQCGWAA